MLSTAGCVLTFLSKCPIQIDHVCIAQLPVTTLSSTRREVLWCSLLHFIDTHVGLFRRAGPGRQPPYTDMVKRNRRRRLRRGPLSWSVQGLFLA